MSLSDVVRSSAALGVALLLLVGCTSSPPEPRPTAEPTSPTSSSTGSRDPLASFYDQKPQWSDCGGGAQCATITVPLDYSKPEGRTIELALLKVPASGDRIGSLLVNPGGPGVSGKDYARNAQYAFDDSLRSSFDIVGWDPRGVGDSTSVDCVDNSALDRLIAADGTPDTAAERQRLLRLSDQFVAGCRARSGTLLAHIGTEDSARDMDVIRAVLGQQKLDYFGASYGTLLGATYADQFPKNVGRFVLDGAVDPSIDSRELGRVQAEGFETALNAFIDDCLTRDGCPLGPTRDAARLQLRGLLDRADAAPLPTGTSRPLTESLALTGMFAALYSQAQGWPALRIALQRALQGDGSVLLQLADLYTERQSDGSFKSNVNEAFPSISCTDEPTDLTVKQIEHDSVTWQRSAPLFGEPFAWGQYTCSIWPLPAKGPRALQAKGADPILVIGTTRDPATPYQWAVNLADQLSSGVLLTRDGDGHTGYNAGNSCVDQAVDRYLLDGVVPRDGTSC
ncbi:MAG: alpha/beta hydrolase [Actinomycetes bacterium]